jgi:oligopeptide transport system permease protein
MAKYIVKRIALAVVTLFVVSTITFFLMFLVPGGPFLAEKAPSAATLAALEAKYGLDQPVIVQYKNYMFRLITGDLGTSLKQRGREVNDIISSRLPVSARIGGLAVLIAVTCGVSLGSVAALNRGKRLDSFIIFFSTCGIAVPSFVVCTVLMFFLGVRLNLLPTYGLSGPLNYIMPVMALSFYPMAYISRLMRSCMLDVLGQDYMRTARAKGLFERVVIIKHGLRNALIPLITLLALTLPSLFGGAIITETIFSWPGMGRMFIDAISNVDWPVVQGLLVISAALVVFSNLLADILYAVVDPRIKYN